MPVEYEEFWHPFSAGVVGRCADMMYTDPETPAPQLASADRVPPMFFRPPEGPTA
jgi:hypothetical protein